MKLVEFKSAAYPTSVFLNPEAVSTVQGIDAEETRISLTSGEFYLVNESFDQFSVV